MNPLATNSALQLLHMSGHVMHVLSQFPCGRLIDPGWSVDRIVAHMQPIVSGLPAHEQALELGAKTLAAIRGFAGARSPDAESRVVTASIEAFLEFRRAEELLCCIDLH